MQRDLLIELQAWKNHLLRKPLIIRGARQTGKSWLVDVFGKEFDVYVKLDFDKDKSARKIFDGDLHVEKLLENISLYTNKKIVVGKTLLFLDEIQDCENAINALRYFKEDLPELHVIAAGSLIDFALDNIGIPVGRIQFMYLNPLSFGEFLTASGFEDLRKHIFSLDVNLAIHEKLLEMLKTYMWLGGMPEVVDAWLKNKDGMLCQRLQDELIESYMQDFHKYARERQIEYVSKIFESIPIMFGKKFIFSHVDINLRAEPLKKALFLLEKAGVARICYHTSGQEIPLGASINEKKFKVYFLDIGLAQRILGLRLDKWILNPMHVKTLGGIAEQLVAQEFIAYTNVISKEKLYYWHREAKSSNAEVDFIVVKNNDIIPVEVKSGTKGSLWSLHYFLENHKNSSTGLKISTGQFSKNQNIDEIPLYAIEAWLNK